MQRRVKRHAWLLGLIIPGCSSEGDRDSVRSEAAHDSAAPQALAADSATTPWQVGPATAGPLSGRTSAAELRRRYGAQNVERTRVELGEGETAPGTVLYPSDSLRRLEILWRDTVAQQGPARIVLRGQESKWQVGRGISLGTSLQDLERLNGRPFTLAGFGWDYAGVVTSWNGGSLESALAGIKLYLDPGPAQYESAPYSQVIGDRDYSSALPAMQQLNPRVAQIFVDFE
jgi:hypothetical protein